MTRVSVEQLTDVMTAALLQRGLSHGHATFVVDGLIRASLRGIDTHGIRLFSTYLDELDGGRAKALPDLQWTPAGHAGKRLDAGGALGLVAGMVATREASQLARSQGIAMVSIVNSNHFGAASTYTIDIARAGQIGVCCSNADKLMAPFEGTRPFFGTNPLSIAALGHDDELFCLDMATSQVAYSQVKARLARGEPLPEGWAHDDGTLKPLGGYKGAGLGMAITLLTALLGDMPLDHDLSHFYAEPFDQPRTISHTVIAIDVSCFVAPNLFRRRLTEYLRFMRQEPGTVKAPGDLEAAATRDRTANGIPLSADELAKFHALGLPT